MDCHYCGTEDAPLQCSRCRTVRYCGDACADAAWTAGHDHECWDAREDDPETIAAVLEEALEARAHPDGPEGEEIIEDALEALYDGDAGWVPSAHRWIGELLLQDQHEPIGALNTLDKLALDPAYTEEETDMIYAAMDALEGDEMHPEEAWSLIEQLTRAQRRRLRRDIRGARKKLRKDRRFRRGKRRARRRARRARRRHRRAERGLKRAEKRKERAEKREQKFESQEQEDEEGDIYDVLITAMQDKDIPLAVDVGAALLDAEITEDDAWDLLEEIGRKRKWIARARLKRGTFRRQARRHKMSVSRFRSHVLKKRRRRGHRHTSVTKKRAVLARTFAKMRRKKRRRKSRRKR